MNVYYINVYFIKSRPAKVAIQRARLPKSISLMFDKLITTVQKRRFRAALPPITTTPAITTTSAPLKFVTLLQHADVLPYLVSIKSVFRSFNEGSVLVVDDGSLTSDDRAVLGEHIRGIEFKHISEVDNPYCPRGSCWERLLTLIDEAASAYAIQVDADLVACGELREAAEHWRDNRAFALGNRISPGLVTLQEMSDWLEFESGWDNAESLQLVSERNLKNLLRPDERHYLRASAAFAGVARGSVSRAMLEEFSQEMQGLLEERWSEWGSEQVASNYCVANSNSPSELKPPRYVNHTPLGSLEDAVLVHFFGTYRYMAGNYRAHAKRVIEQLSVSS